LATSHPCCRRTQTRLSCQSARQPVRPLVRVADATIEKLGRWLLPSPAAQFNLAREVANDDAARDAFERLSKLTMGSGQFGNHE
jgi:hypothetical protein